MEHNLKKIPAAVLAVVALWLLPHLAFAATLYISPASGSFAVGSTFSVSVRVDTQNAAVNSAEATVNYSADTLELVKVSPGPTFTLQTPGSPSQQDGSAFFSGGLPTPGYTGPAGALGVMTFRATALGSASLSISGGKVLLNDGLGTDALSSSSGAEYAIIPAPAAAAGQITVNSQSHPDQQAWYSQKDVALSWDRPAGVYGYSFIFDQSPSTVPDDILDTTITTTHTYANVADGVWYFHIHGRSRDNAQYGSLTNFQVNIDTVPPEPFSLGVEGQPVTAGQPVSLPAGNFQIVFNAADQLSGIDHYDVFMDGQLLKSGAASPYALGQPALGSHTVKVTAFDKAGNSTDATLGLNILPPVTSPATVSFPRLYLWILLAMFLMLNALVWAVFFYRRKLWEARYIIRELEHELKQEESQKPKAKRKVSVKIKPPL